MDTDNTTETEPYFDELYDEKEKDCEENNDNKLLIIQMASQLTRNMDISKLSLPANLCEKRSILETYSDYFSHTNLFLRIAQMDSAKERMISCIKWYLSTFSASRKTKLAKKPYNPILGEVFKCKFRVKNGEHEAMVSYISEQVSHHPPILAFYVEDDSRQVSLTSQLYLRSRFLGLSVSVEMIGEARLLLPQKDNEEYIITFPTGYCNGIFTTPWLELGGSSRISCSKTGYEAKIIFKRQGYFFGQRDKVEVQIYCPEMSKPFLSIKGFWSGSLIIKENSSSKEEVFMDVRQIPFAERIVLPRSKQYDFESRKVWEDVTRHLRNRDLKAAVNSKNEIEQEQRNQASQRLRDNVDWKLRHFIKKGKTYEFLSY